MVHQEEISIRTQEHHEIHDLTNRVLEVVRKSGVQTGIANVFNVGSTAALGAIELEPGLAQDFPALLERLIPAGQDYAHEETWHDGNGHSHLQATLMGPSLTIPVADGKPVLGAWQQVFLIECDVKPRRRSVLVTVMGE
ncbi:MAG: secondary thiamine-phosphate synthase enzyme YjbQ [Armatimonadetes bacterium]|nr:secondary thiamine-phosphate synthase enzyme YjbQ [Armatimonadota bacterium]